MPKKQDLAIGLIKTDQGTQSRVAINTDTVEEYAELIKDAYPDWPFEPIDVFNDGDPEVYFLSDGFHRFFGAETTDRGSIPCRVHEGDAFDALVFGMTANDKHGLRPTRADKKSCVERLLDCGRKLTQTAIADMAGVSRRTVAMIVAERKPPASSQSGGQNVQIAHSSPKKKGDSTPEPDPFDDMDPFGEDAATEGTGTEQPEENSTGPPRSGTEKPGGSKPPRKLSREDWLRQWDQAIGPLVRLVDKIASGVGEKGCQHHETVQDHLNVATEEMMEWMGGGK